jgi:hypothetical protein
VTTVPGEPSWRRYAHLAAIAAVYAVACRVMLAPICNFSHLATASYEGDARGLIWVLAWDNHALLDRVPSLFDANNFYPARNALAYGEHLFGISLFTLPVYAITRNPVLSYNIVWLLSYLLTAACAHFVAWRHTRDHLAATVAGLAFAFCFFRMHHGHGHLNIIWALWIPLSLVALERWVERPTWPRLGAFVTVVVLQALGSWYQGVMIVVADVSFFAWLLVVERARPPLSRLMLQGGAGVAIALAIVWPFARHYFALSSGPAVAAAGSADLAGFVVPPENTFIGQWLIAHGIKGPRWIWGELTVYLGWTALLWALAGAVVALRGRDQAARRLRFFIVLGGIAVALAAGPSPAAVAAGSWGWTPFGLLAHVPRINLFRVPARYAELVTLAVAMLAGGAAAASHARFGHAGRCLTIVLIPLMLSEFYLVKFPGGQPPPSPVPRVYKFIATLPPGAVVSFPDYANTTKWFVEANYQYFSTVHWHPIANGDSRAQPPGFRALMDRLRTFPDPSSAATMREVGISYVVLHAGQAAGGSDVVTRARASGDFRLLTHLDDDYLFEVVHAGR